MLGIRIRLETNLFFLLHNMDRMLLSEALDLYNRHTVYTKYGFPYWWLMHVSVTIAGVTDIWRFETSNLVKDMVLEKIREDH